MVTLFLKYLRPPKSKETVALLKKETLWFIKTHICFFPSSWHLPLKAKLQALITLRQKSSQWRRNLQGYSWHTEEDLKTVLKWPQPFSWTHMKIALNRWYIPALHIQMIANNIYGIESDLQMDGLKDCGWWCYSITHLPSQLLKGRKWMVLSSTAQSASWPRLHGVVDMHGREWGWL